MTQEDITHKQQLLAIFTERLQYLEIQSAIFGSTNVPFVIAKEISDLREKIRKLKHELGDLEIGDQISEEIENNEIETGRFGPSNLGDLAQLKQEQARFKFDMHTTNDLEHRSSLKREIRKLQEQIDDLDYALRRQGIKPVGMSAATREWIFTGASVVLILGVGIFVGFFEGFAIAIVCFILWIILKGSSGGIGGLGGGSMGGGIGT